MVFAKIKMMTHIIVIIIIMYDYHSRCVLGTT